MGRVEARDEFELVLEAIAVGVVRGVMVRPLDIVAVELASVGGCLLYTSPSPRDGATSRMPSSA